MDSVIKVKILDHFNDLELPNYATKGSAGLDLRAAIEKDIILPSLQRILIPTGVCLELKEGIEAQVRSRSGLALKYGVSVLNSPGTIDSDYRGEVKVILMNFSDVDFKISRGDRIAQLVISKYERVNLVLEDNISETGRMEEGFGSTGKN